MPCDIIPLTQPKACTGKCSGTCKSSGTWVLAACGGMVSLFERHADGGMTLLRPSDEAITPRVEELQQFLLHASQENKFSQLVLVGTANDIAWAEAILPESMTAQIVAEIQYPLIPTWFREEASLPKLTKALEQVFAA